MLTLLVVLLMSLSDGVGAQVEFETRSVRSGAWSDQKTWAGNHVPKAGDNVQVRAGHTVTYDLNGPESVRVLHVAGTLRFATDRNTRLGVGLLKIQAGDDCSEDGFNCHDSAETSGPGPHSPPWEPALEIGTRGHPLPAAVTAVVQLVYFQGMDSNALPAIINCGGRMDLHGAPMNRTWVKLGKDASAGQTALSLAEPVTGWKPGDRIIVTASKENDGGGTSFRPTARRPRAVQTEERTIVALEAATISLDKALTHEHFGRGETRSEVANLTRNIVIESADPAGIRGHTMYHCDSGGGISYAEFRHLGKEGILGKYAIHFHLVRETMRGSGVTGASIWDSHNRWITIHGTDYLLVRDCVGYQSVGHGFFLEDATEQYNIFDRNLAVQAYRGKRLPRQALGFDPNDGAAFWWANGRNSFVRNVACENDEYGYRFEVARRSQFNPVLSLRQPDGSKRDTDVRTVPFLRFEDNESHSEGLYSFNFGDDEPGSVHGDREHPFVVRDLRAWQTHYALRPNVQFFLMDGLTVRDGVYGVYHPDYDAQVFRRIRLNNVVSEPINRGHDDESVQHGTFTYEDVRMENCRVGRDPLIQLTCTSSRPGQAGHFRRLTVTNSLSRQGKLVDLGGGPRNDKLQHPVAYFLHDYTGAGHVTKVVSAKFAPQMTDADYQPIPGVTGKDVRAAEVSGVAFPELLAPVDDLPPATMITFLRLTGDRLYVRGTSQDNGEIAEIVVNGTRASIALAHAGLVDWEIVLEPPLDGRLVAHATDIAGNTERVRHELKL